MRSNQIVGRHIPHVKQTFNWDCGLACTEMALRALGVRKTECSLPKLREQVPATSIWTVDLAYVLRDFGIRFRYLTKTLGVDPSYQTEAFYRPTLDADSMRVNKLFSQAASKDIAIERRSIKGEELQGIMKPRDHMVMALVDRRFLYRPPSVSGMVESVISRCFSGYVGHYILITGYDEKRRGYFIMDPAKASDTPDVNFVPCDAVDRARRSHGTDEDLVIIPWEQPQPLRRRQDPGFTASAA